MGVLTVKLLKVTHLKDSDGLGKSDPYVKFELEQDNMVFDRNYGKKVSTKKKNVLSPEYNETFEFDSVPTMNNMVLNVKIMDDDIGLDDKIGSCKINLERLHITETPKAVDAVVERKGPKLSLCCCFSMCKHNATIYLEISFTEQK
jgi:Ca2+-dependent lipid-binding protein